MGRIEDGKISGTLPNRVAFAVDYPGYPSTVERSIQTLGGEEGLAKVRASESNFLELKFRPEDPFAHPAFGELRHTSNLVLRLSRKTVKCPAGRQAQASNELDSSRDVVDRTSSGRQTRKTNEEFEVQEHEVEAEIIAKVEHTYTFDGMADYQYVMAVHADGNKSHKPKGVDDIPVKEVDPNEMTILVPPLFSMKDIPEEIFLRQPVGRKRKQFMVDVQEDQDDMPVPCFALDFRIKEVPNEGNWEHNLQRGSEPWLRTAALVRLFQERPIWTRTLLNERLIEQGIVVTGYYLKVLLFSIAYYFNSGPFRNLWIRNGYDPRSDPESRAHQIIDFRVPSVLRSQTETVAEPPRKFTFLDLCAFKVAPQKKFTQFQLIDVQDDDIRARIESPPERKTCSETTGWYRLSTIKRLRQIIRLRFLALYPGRIARVLESAERRNWERTKLAPETEEERPVDDDRSNSNVLSVLQTCQTNDQLAKDEGNQLTTEDPVSVADQLNGVDLSAVEDDDEDDDEDEGDIGEDVDQLDDDGLKTNLDEDEDDDEEEELEEDTEGLLSGQGHVEDNVPPYLDPTDIIPKNYLQALLGKFASNSSGDEPRRAVDFDDDDEQYTIYEEDEDEDE